ncbi:NAD dependent epimerase/dehydratase [Venturia nashicola]|uniref:NAD dependent epimerase/dehydratase n=1 Tax=Venturia nashicola TaxID=86259 RepID=A0A4Z1NTH0_9PEZI|nr:NAD dependent epimerase/dehydratase [Venturia nashicola]TLD20068.1 NAD dependent epimerase/dehydratase [Venturia nashicola]
MLSTPKILVLITGATGHIGFRTLILTLAAGHHVRAAVRSTSKAQFIASHPKILALNCSSRLSFTIVPDLACLHAYDKAVKNVKYIIHIAAPLMPGKLPQGQDSHTFFIRPAVRGSIGILSAAKKAGTVRRIIITSSLVAIVPLAQLTGCESSSRPIQPTDRVEFPEGPYESEFAAYAASKVAALSAAENWMKRQSPSFDLIHLHPSFVLGKNDIATTTREAMQGTNSIVLGMVLGKPMDSIASASVHLEDVARVHVQALDQIVPGNQFYILSQETEWSCVCHVVDEAFSEAVESRLLPNCGSAETHEVLVDSSLTEAIFGFKHKALEEQVKSVVGHYLELKAKRSWLEPMGGMKTYSSPSRVSGIVA